MTKAALSSVFYGKRESRVIFLENFPIQKRKNWKKIQKETHFITQKKEKMKLSIAFVLAFWYPILVSTCCFGLYCYCCNPCKKRLKKKPLLPN